MVMLNVPTPFSNAPLSAFYLLVTNTIYKASHGNKSFNRRFVKARLDPPGTTNLSSAPP